MIHGRNEQKLQDTENKKKREDEMLGMMHYLEQEPVGKMWYETIDKAFGEG